MNAEEFNTDAEVIKIESQLARDKYMQIKAQSDFDKSLLTLCYTS